MDSGRLIFDSSLSRSSGVQMIALGGGNMIYRGAGPMLALVDDGVGGKRRPFFTGPNEYFEEEYYDEQMCEKKRRLTPEQVHQLEKSFESENKLEPERKTELATKLGLQPRQVAVWFQNRRARWKNKQLEGDYDRLKASYDSLLIDHESLLKDNDSLRSQVLLLTEKLQAKEKSGQGTTEVKENYQGADLAGLIVQQKSEDGLSSGSNGSSVVDRERGQKLVDCNGESYFPEGYNCVGPLDGGVQSEEDGFSDEGCSYYPDPIFTENNQAEVDAQLFWSVWS